MVQSQPTAENLIAFIASILSGTSSAIGNNPSLMIYGLVIASVGKALPSLGQNNGWKSVEDWFLFIGATAGFLASSLSNIPQYVIWGVIFGMIGKAIPSIINYRKDPSEIVEDVISLVIVVIGGVVYFLQNDPNHASLVLALGIIAKALPSLQGTNSPSQQNTQQKS